MEGEGEVAVVGGDGVVNGDELSSVGEGSFDLDFVDHFGDAGEGLVASEELAAEVHEFRNGFAVADEFKKLRGDECDGFGVVEFEAAGETFLGEGAGVVEGEFFDVMRGEVHLSVLKTGSHRGHREHRGREMQTFTSVFFSPSVFSVRNRFTLMGFLPFSVPGVFAEEGGEE